MSKARKQSIKSKELKANSTADVIATLRHVNKQLDPVAAMAAKAITCPVEEIALRQSDLWAAYGKAADPKDRGPRNEELCGTMHDAVDANFLIGQTQE